MINLNKFYKKFLNPITQFLIKVRNKFLPSSIRKEAIRWNKDGGDFALRYNYFLNENSIVFDIGGFKGDFASDLYARMPCKIYIFEPVNEYYLTIKKRFKFNNMIEAFNFGLSNKTESKLIEIKGESSSIFFNNFNNTNNDSKEKINLVDINDFIQEKNIFEIDLMKINIEGGEYNLIKRLLKKNKICNIKYLQVQFHYLNKNSIQEKNQIRKLLKNTHYCQYCYEFVWENWIRKDL